MHKKDKTSRLRSQNRKQGKLKRKEVYYGLFAQRRWKNKAERQEIRSLPSAEKYSMGLTKFTALAKEAKAVYKIDKVTLVNCEIFERYLESFRIP